MDYYGYHHYKPTNDYTESVKAMIDVILEEPNRRLAVVKDCIDKLKFNIIKLILSAHDNRCISLYIRLPETIEKDYVEYIVKCIRKDYNLETWKFNCNISSDSIGSQCISINVCEFVNTFNSLFREYYSLNLSNRIPVIYANEMISKYERVLMYPFNDERTNAVQSTTVKEQGLILPIARIILEFIWL